MGGGYLNSNWGWFTYFAYLYPMLLAKHRGIPIYVSAVTFGPFTGMDQDIVHSCLSCVDRLYLREEPHLVDRALLSSLHTDYRIVGDDLMGAGRRLDVAVNIHQPNIVENLAPLLQDRRVMFLPFSTWHTADIKHGHQLKVLVPDCTVADASWDVAKECIREAVFVISTRLHPLILAKDSGTPGLGVPHNKLYQVKLSGTGFPTVEPENIRNLTPEQLMSPRQKGIGKLTDFTNTARRK
jgi:hypothetical protein